MAPRSLGPRKEPKQQRSLETRRRILDAAARVFAEHGYGAGTTNRIAAAAGLSIGSLYQYFPNKDAILLALVNEHVDRGIVALADRLGGAGAPRLGVGADDVVAEPLDELLHQLVRATIDLHRDEPELHRVLFEEGLRPPELLNRLHALETWLVVATDQLLTAHPEVRVADTALAARLVVGTVESLVHRQVASRDPVPLDRFEDEVVALLSRYLRGGP